MHDVTLATEFLHAVPPFNLLEAADLEKLARKLEASYFPQGKTIFESSPPPGLAIIRKGAVRLVDHGQKFLDKRSEAELFGHSIYFHGELKDYIAQAEEDCLLWQLPQDDFIELCETYPLLGEYFSSHLQTRLRAAAQVRSTVTQVRDLLRREPVMVSCGASIRKAARLMSRENVSSVLVMKDGALGGIMTDKDLRQRVIAAGVDTGASICDVMTANPMTLTADAGVDEATKNS